MISSLTVISLKTIVSSHSTVEKKTLFISVEPDGRWLFQMVQNESFLPVLHILPFFLNTSWFICWSRVSFAICGLKISVDLIFFLIKKINFKELLQNWSIRMCCLINIDSSVFIVKSLHFPWMFHKKKSIKWHKNAFPEVWVCSSWCLKWV